MLPALIALSTVLIALSVIAYQSQVSAQPLGNPRSELVSLGQRLFEDQRLSGTRNVSCGTCHQPARAFTDGRAVALGARAGTRNVPSLANLQHVREFFWDGRDRDLNRVVLEAFTNPAEHGLQNVEELLALIRADDEYVKRFRSAFGISASGISPTQVGAALRAFVEAISEGSSAFDRFFYAKEKNAIASAAVRGLHLFQGHGGCARCHSIGAQSAPFTDNDFHRLGIGSTRIERKLPQLVQAARKLDRGNLGHVVLTDAELAELGRYLVTGNLADIGKFRTPSLRNVALTAPYMHDGSIATLEQAVEFELYYRVMSDGRQILLTADEKRDLVEFLKSLSSDRLLAK